MGAQRDREVILWDQKIEKETVCLHPNRDGLHPSSKTWFPGTRTLLYREPLHWMFLTFAQVLNVQ